MVRFMSFVSSERSHVIGREVELQDDSLLEESRCTLMHFTVRGKKDPKCIFTFYIPRIWETLRVEVPSRAFPEGFNFKWVV